MGEVWKARDTRLNREVAIKFSKEQFTERFAREARAIAALNHTNVCHLYDVGPNYLVMEFVEGETLVGPMPLKEAVPIIHQLIDGIEIAHENNIVHRDLKPANLKITPDGIVKILDFGLAKAVQDSVASTAPGEASENSPTLTVGITQAGTILGTAAYMSPEQARGKTADRRSDIWSFGAIVYELLTGKRAFEGETVVETLGKVMHKEPDWSAVPPQMRKLIQWCLEKDRKKRLQAIGDARTLLDETVVNDAATVASPRLLRSAMAIAVIAILGLAALAFIHFREMPPAAPPMHFLIALPEGVAPGHFALSPDGHMLAMNHRGQIWIRSIDSPELRSLSGTDGARAPFWSADSRTIGFFADGKLKIVPAAGGPTQTLCTDTGLGSGGTWNGKGVILFATEAGVLYRVSAAGGTCTPLTSGPANIDSRIPVFLPDGKHFLYAKGLQTGDESVRGLYLASLDEPIGRRLLADSSSAIFVPSKPGGTQGQLLFLRETNLMAQPFDAGSFQLIGDAVALAQQASTSNTPPQIAASASETGTVVYLANLRPDTQLSWFDRSGKVLAKVGPSARRFGGVTLSPDGKQIAFVRGTPSGEFSLWLRDLERNTETRLTSPPLAPFSAVWSGDGRRIAFASSGALYLKDATGGGQEQVLDHGARTQPSDISRDGRWMVFTETDPKTAGDIWLLTDPLVPTANHRRVAYLRTPSNESQGQISPDGKWLAYTSDESGADQIYIRPFPAGDIKWLVSAGIRGTEPRWRADGKELFYLERPIGGSLSNKVMAVTIGPGTSPVIGVPKQLFEFSATTTVTQGNLFVYSPSPDGQRFVIKAYATEAQPTLDVLLNWQKTAGGK
jgi:Tol biopolymer transport system component